MREPLMAGRVLRFLAGLASFYLAYYVFSEATEFGGYLGSLALLLLGASFLLGALTSNPGCEVTSIPNALLGTRWHFF